MNTRSHAAGSLAGFVTGLACLSLSAGSLLFVPAVAHAQDAQAPGNDPNSSSDASNQSIKLDLENADLYSALKLLFAQIKANYTLDPTLRQLPVTAHLTNVPFRTALDILLRSANSPVPLTYRVESGVYTIQEKKPDIGPVEEAPAPDQPLTSNKLQYKKFYGSTGQIKYNSYYLARILGAKIIPSIVQEHQGQGGFGGGGFGGGLGSGGGVGSGGSLGGFSNGGSGSFGSGGTGSFAGGNGFAGSGGAANGGGGGNRGGF